MRRTFWLTTVCGILLAALFLSTAPGQDARGVDGKAALAWEYRIALLPDVVKVDQDAKPRAEVAAAFEARFNELGRDGWELTLSLPGAVVFKRPKR